MSRIPLTALICALALMLAPAAASAAPPPNDDFANAQSLSGTSPSATGTIVDATCEPGEPTQHAGVNSGSIWYEWTAPYTGGVTIDTGGTDFPNTLAVYTGDEVDALSPVRHTSGWGEPPARVAFRTVAGTTYRIAVAGTFPLTPGAAGRVELNVSLRPPPANDDFAAAQVVPSVPDDATVAGRNDGASGEPGEPSHYNFVSARSTVWYSWTAPRRGSLTIEASGSPNTVVAAYRGNSVDSLTPEARQALAGDRSPHRFRLRVLAGTTYRIAIDNHGHQPGDFTLAFRLRDSPPNDDFDAAQALAGEAVEVHGTVAHATHEPGEPAHEPGTGTAAASVWYTWTAPADGGVVVNFVQPSAGSARVYTGDDLDSLSSNRLHGHGFRAEAGTTYRIAVTSTWDEQDPFHLTVTWEPAPSNDMFASAETLTVNDDPLLRGDNVGATRESGEPGGGASIWYSWTAPSSGRATLSLPHTELDQQPAVYTGDSVDALTFVAGGEEQYQPSDVRFRAQQGTVYRIALAGGSLARQGYFTLELDLHPSPPNDDFANPVVLSGVDDSAAGTTAYATRELGEPEHSWHGSGGRSIWFSWTAPKSGRAHVSVDGGGGWALAAYTGSSVDDLELVNSVNSNWLELGFDAKAGVTYRIAFDSYGDRPVQLTLRETDTIDEGTGSPGAPRDTPPPGGAGDGTPSGGDPPGDGRGAPGAEPSLALSVPRQRLRAVLRRGLAISARHSGPATIRATVAVRGQAGRGRASARTERPGRTRLAVRLPRALRHKLRHARSARLTVTVRATVGGRQLSATRRLTVRR